MRTTAGFSSAQLLQHSGYEWLCANPEIFVREGQTLITSFSSHLLSFVFVLIILFCC